MEQSLVDGGVEQQHDETRPMPVQNFQGGFVFGHATSSGFGPGIYTTLDMEGWGRFWQYFAKDQSARDIIPPRHIVPEVATQPRANFFDPAGPWGWGGVHPIHHALRPERSISADEVLVTPQYLDVKQEGDSEDVYPRDDVHHATGQAGVEEASPVDDPEVRFTEMVGVEEGGQEEGAVDYSLAVNPILSDAVLESIRVNRSGARARGVDPLHVIKEEEPHSTWDHNHNLIVRPRGGRMDVPTGMRSQKYKNFCAETYRVEKRSMEWMARKVELGLVAGSHLSNFAKEDHGTMAVFIKLWTATLLQKVWVSRKALMRGLRVKLQQKVEAAAIEEAVLVAVGLISSLLHLASNHQRERAPGDVVTRADVHQAARDMVVNVLLELANLWRKDAFDINGLPSEVVDRFASRYFLVLGYGVPREVAAMATARVAAVGGHAWDHVNQGKIVKEGQARNMSRRCLLVGASYYVGVLEVGRQVPEVVPVPEVRSTLAESYSADMRRRKSGL